MCCFWPDSEIQEGEADDADEWDEFVLETVDVEHSDTERRFDSAVSADNCSSLRRR